MTSRTWRIIYSILLHGLSEACILDVKQNQRISLKALLQFLILHFVLIMIFLRQGLYSLDLIWRSDLSQTHTNPPASVSEVLRLKVSTTVIGIIRKFQGVNKINVFIIASLWGWRNGLVVESTSLSSRKSRFNSQHTYSGSQLLLTTAAGGLIPSFEFKKQEAQYNIQTYMQSKYIETFLQKLFIQLCLENFILI